MAERANCICESTGYAPDFKAVIGQEGHSCKWACVPWCHLAASGQYRFLPAILAAIASSSVL